MWIPPSGREPWLTCIQPSERSAFEFGGTFFPARRASERPIAIACLGLMTFFPLRPLVSVPRASPSPRAQRSCSHRASTCVVCPFISAEPVFAAGTSLLLDRLCRDLAGYFAARLSIVRTGLPGRHALPHTMLDMPAISSCTRDPVTGLRHNTGRVM